MIIAVFIDNICSNSQIRKDNLKTYFLQRRWRPAAGWGPAESLLPSWQLARNIPLFNNNELKMQNFAEFVMFSTCFHQWTLFRQALSECPTLECSTVCRSWSIAYFSEATDPGAPAFPIGQRWQSLNFDSCSLSCLSHKHHSNMKWSL